MEAVFKRLNDEPSMMIRTDKVAVAHIPKTGGRRLAAILRAFAPDPHWFHSFFGIDSSQGGNQVLIEAIRLGDAATLRILKNAHFQAATVVTGHFSCNLDQFFPEYRFKYCATIRDPIDRTISNIYQYSIWSPKDNVTEFAGFRLPSKIDNPGDYWDGIRGILQQAGNGPIGGLLTHENLMLRNGMCRVLAGDRLYRWRSQVNLDAALERAETMEIALFERFNATVSASLQSVGIDLALDADNNPLGQGRPTDHLPHDPDYGCPPEVREIVTDMNETDIRLYDALRERMSFLDSVGEP